MTFSVLLRNTLQSSIRPSRETPHVGAAPLTAGAADLCLGRPATTDQLREYAYRAVDRSEWLVICSPDGAGRTSLLQWLMPKLERLKGCHVAYYDSYTLSVLLDSDGDATKGSSASQPPDEAGAARNSTPMRTAERRERSRPSVTILDVDGWEGRGARQQQELLELCCRAVARTEGSQVVILAGHEELIESLSQNEDFQGRLESAPWIPIDHPTRKEIGDLIQAQCHEFGWELPIDLIERIGEDYVRLLEDSNWRPEAFRLVQATLRELYLRDQMNLAGYASVGGLTGLSRYLAEEALMDASPEFATAAQRLFLRLVDVGEGAADTLAPRAIEEFVDDDSPAENQLVLDQLESLALITVAGDGQRRWVRCLHDSLLRNWPTLRQWIETNRDVLRIVNRLRIASSKWFHAGYASSCLLPESELLYVACILDGKEHLLSALERRFVEASQRRLSSARRRERTLSDQKRQLPLGKCLRLSSQIRNLKADSMDHIQSLTARHEAELSELRSRHSYEVSALKAELVWQQTRIAEATAQIQRVREEYESQLKKTAKSQARWRLRALAVAVAFTVGGILYGVFAR